MTFNLYNIIKIKGEGLPSPFIFLVILLGFINISWAQLGTKNWLHPDPNFITIEDSCSHLHLYNDTHIGIINFNDSLNISENKQGFKLVNRTSKGMIKFVYNKHHSIAQIIGEDYSSTNSINYSEILLGYKSKNGIITSDVNVAKYFTLSLFFLKIWNIPEFNVSFSCSFYFTVNFIYQFYKNLFKKSLISLSFMANIRLDLSIN